MPMRWRWPPENSCGIAVEMLVAQADQRQQLGGAIGALPRREPDEVVMDLQRLGDDVVDGHARIERGVGILEDDLDLARAARASSRGDSVARSCPS